VESSVGFSGEGTLDLSLAIRELLDRLTHPSHLKICCTSGSRSAILRRKFFKLRFSTAKVILRGHGKPFSTQILTIFSSAYTIFLFVYLVFVRSVRSIARMGNWAQFNCSSGGGAGMDEGGRKEGTLKDKKF